MTAARPPRRRRRPRVGLRGLMLLVLAAGAGLGWLVRRAEVQRMAVAAVERSGGWVSYDQGMRWPWDQWEPPGWLVAAAGRDHFEDVTRVCLYDGATDADLALVARLPRLAEIMIHAPKVTDAGLAALSGLAGLKGVNLSGPGPTGAALAHLAAATGLESLTVSAIPLGDADLAHVAGLTGLLDLGLSDARITDAGLAHLPG